jgi:hypothetical protein
MSTGLTQSIQVLPLVRKFLAKHYTIEPFQLSAINNPFAMFLLNSLDVYPSKEEVQGFDKLSATLEVSMTKKQVRYHGYGRHFNQKKVFAFSSFVRSYFMQVAVREMDVRVQKGESVVKAAQAILKRYDLSEDELSLDSLTRHFRAYNKTINELVVAAW